MLEFAPEILIASIFDTLSTIRNLFVPSALTSCKKYPTAVDPDEIPSVGLVLAKIETDPVKECCVPEAIKLLLIKTIEPAEEEKIRCCVVFTNFPAAGPIFDALATNTLVLNSELYKNQVLSVCFPICQISPVPSPRIILACCPTGARIIIPFLEADEPVINKPSTPTSLKIVIVPETVVIEPAEEERIK